MKKLIFYFVFLCLAIPVKSTVIEEFHALQTKQQEKLFMNKYAQSSLPQELAYYYAVLIKQCSYINNPLKKWSEFNNISRKIDQLVMAYPKDVNFRYVRLVIQEKTPLILGYKQFIAADKKILLAFVASDTENAVLKKYIYLNTSI
jgi:hypothetical protein